MPLLAHSQNNERGAGTDPADAAQASKTGLPDELKVGIESLSGMAMDDVEVHYNSSKPAEVQALAYTLGTQIHVGPGQEQYLPHEAWHVVQQKQGRVKPTMQANEVAINDDQGLEKEADQMGNKAIQMKCAECEKDVAQEENAVQAKTGDSRTMQLAKGDSCYCPGNRNSPYFALGEYNDQIGPGEAFTVTTMTDIYGANAAKSTKAKIQGGVQSSYASDSDGGALVKLSDVNNMIAEVDHIVPQVSGGCNSVKNAQVISSYENSPAHKGDIYPYGGYAGRSVFDPTNNEWYKNKTAATNAGATNVGNLP